MKIIKEGTVPETNGKCPVCGCEFIYDRRDVAVDSEYGYRVECPCCKDKLMICGESKVTLKIV